IGVSRTNSRHQIELLEWFVRDHLNRDALRRMAVLRPLRLVITDWPDGHVDTVDVVNNPEDPTAGTRAVPFGGELWIEQDDFRLDPPPKYFRLTPGREVRLRAAYLVTCTDADTDADGNVTTVYCTHDPESRGGTAPDGRKVKSTMHWVSAAHAIEGSAMLYDRLFSAEVPGDATGDPMDDLNVASREILTGCRFEPVLGDAAPGDVVQFERLGYFAHDPRTPLLFHRTVGLRDEWARISARS
ncbi:MAG: glutamine--tRNA ligase, partial [Ilumatobacteraceae bacterium]